MGARPSLTLVNGPEDNHPSFYKVVEQAVGNTANRGTQRHLYIISCYYDLHGLKRLVCAAKNGLASVRARLSGISVAVDVTEWIGHRQSRKQVIQGLRKASGSKDVKVEFIPVHVHGRLVHAKAVAAIGPGRVQGSLEGVVISTSANATRRGTGIDKSANIEIASTSDQGDHLAQFKSAFETLCQHEIGPNKEARQDRFLFALELLRLGVFYHKWEGNLASSVRFTLDLTDKGRSARRAGAGELGEYDSDSNSMSRDPLGVESIFVAVPKPFPRTFWKSYSVDTLLGRWTPKGIANLVDEVGNEDVEPYLKELRRLVRKEHLDAIERDLSRQVRFFRKEGWITNSNSVVDTWRKRVLRFVEQEDLIRLRILNYEQVPDMLDAQNRRVIEATFERLEAHVLHLRKPSRLKKTLKELFEGRLDHDGVRQELARLAKTAKTELIPPPTPD